MAAFERSVQSTPLEVRRETLAWLRVWRRRTDRVFWEIVPDGSLRRL